MREDAGQFHVDILMLRNVACDCDSGVLAWACLTLRFGSIAVLG